MLRLVARIFSALCIVLLGLIAAIFIAYLYFSRDLPDYQKLSDYHPPLVSRFYDNKGGLLGELARQKRLFIPEKQIPDIVKQAFISAEDKNFYTHPGVDWKGIIRAAFVNVDNVLSNRRLQGASTITQQVMKNFLLASSRGFERKIKEAILAMRFEKAFSKEKILELYLNEIYLGNGVYGVAAAALSYFNKELQDLTPIEAAYLAALPKAPSNYHPVRDYDRALRRRNWVLARMMENGYLSQLQFDQDITKPLETVLSRKKSRSSAVGRYFLTSVQRKIAHNIGVEHLYESGLSVRTTLDSGLQKKMTDVFRRGLLSYDQKSGYRGALGRIDNLKAVKDWSEVLKPYRNLRDINWRFAVVTELTNTKARIRLLQDAQKEQGELWLKNSLWARRSENGYRVPRKMADIMKVGDIIYVEDMADKEGVFLLRQVPEINGGMLAMDAHSGAILAMQGGFSYSHSQFNRSTQALRQAGSIFKPFVYLTALEMGYSPASLIYDGPISLPDATGKIWTPKNYDGQSLGNVLMRVGLERSRNLVTVRLADEVGIENILNTVKRLGINTRNMPVVLSTALGSAEVTLWGMIKAYGAFARGGSVVEPYIIETVQDRFGRTIMRRNEHVCEGCQDIIWGGQNAQWSGVLQHNQENEKVIDSKIVYQLTSMLEGVIQRGTGRGIRYLARNGLAGKTGTTNDSKDVWFISYSRDIVIGCYIGFDRPRSLGRKATGSSIAAPIVGQYWQKIKTDFSFHNFIKPAGLESVWIDKKTGDLSFNGAAGAIQEYLIPGVESKSLATDELILENDSYGYGSVPQFDRDYYMPDNIEAVDDMINLGTGGLY